MTRFVSQVNSSYIARASAYMYHAGAVWEVCFQEIIPLIVGYTTASIVHVCITEMVTSLVRSFHSQLFFSDVVAFLQHAKKSWEWRLGTRLDGYSIP